ncbi:MAG: cupin domain-containing protein [Sulfurospirillaceae bacterium]|nr:cupin domain-containing protein [Sulfurospirillaceae bacterium]
MNFFDIAQVPNTGEIFETIYANNDISIERIISSDKQEDKIYKQDHDEWVMLMDGSAVLEIDDIELELKKGDFLLIEKGKVHKVLKTEKGTIWFCVHMKRNDR